MSDSIQSSSPSMETPSTKLHVQETKSTDSSKKTSTGKGGGTFSSSSTVHNLAELKEKAPEVYDGMLKTMATDINNKAREHQEKLKKMMREGQQGG